MTGALATARMRLTEAVRGSAAGQWFAGQAPRDRLVLTLLAGFLILVTLWLAIWLPIQDGLAVARSRHASALVDHRWILANRDAAAQAAALRGSAGSARSGQALLSTVANSARRSGMTLNRFQPEGDDALAVSMDDVAFADLLLWLETLAREEGVRVRQASLDGGEGPGRVRARLVLY
ncbi:MAG TPA: type II secretion system protein M [Pseudomonadales bacterium]|nr:type II secretion system protein M [Pseudomonadales bacterium]